MHLWLLSTMAQQEQNHKYSNSSSGVARSSKKFKQNKLPQRGLGVAQLEKIRLEEQKKKDTVFKLPNVIISPSNSSSCLASPTDHPSSNTIIRQPRVIPNSIDVVRPNSISNNGGGCEMGWQGITSTGSGSWPKLWNDKYNLEGDVSYKSDRQVSNTVRSSVNFPGETKNPVWPLSGVMPRSQPFHAACPSSMIVGFKRTYPFSIDDAPVPSFNCRFPPAYVSHIPPSVESSSLNNDGTFALEQANPVLREGPSASSGMSKYKKKIIKENGGFNGDFLTLAPPKPKDPPSYLGHHIPELPDFDALPYQGAPDVPVYWSGQIQSVEQPFFGFFPSQQNGQSTVTISNSNNLVESVDLNLKL